MADSGFNPWSLATAPISGAFQYAGAKQQAEAQDRATQAQTQAAQQTLAFQRQQAETDYQNQEVNRKANYQQFAARDARIGTLGEAVGLSPRRTPAYVPSIDPQYVQQGRAAVTSQPRVGAAPLAGIDPSAYGSQPQTAAAVTSPPQIGGAPLQASGPMVRLKSPQGQISAVPQSQVMHYLSLGAQYV